MALSKETYVADGLTDLFTVPFPFLAKAHVKVFVGGVEDVNYTWQTPLVIKTSVVPTSGDLVLIQRVTPTTPEVDFVDGSTLTETILDIATLQALYVVEESRDSTEALLQQDPLDNTWEGQGIRIKNVANPVDPQDVATKAWSESAVTSSVAQALTHANTAVAQAVISTTQAGIATTKAAEAAVSKDTATTQAGIATTKAAEAAVSKDTATTQAGIATTQAGIATTKASEASGSATTATTQAGIATTQAGIATTKASEAAESAAIAEEWTLQGASLEGTPIGGYMFVQTDLMGAILPPISKYIQLTAGLTGSGLYNEGKLGSETVSGVAPSVSATAVITDSDSPLNGSTVRLLNTENRYLMPGDSAGAIAMDHIQDIYGTLAVGTGQRFSSSSGAFTVYSSTKDAGGAGGNGGYRGANFQASNVARTADHTNVKRLQVTTFMRIK